MKKLALVAAIMLLFQTVLAESLVTTLNVTDGVINISGESDTEGYVTAKLEKDGSLMYFTQTGISNNEFAFEIGDMGLEGSYDLTVTGADFQYKKTITLPDGGNYIEEVQAEEATIEGLNSLMVVNRAKVSGTVDNYSEDKTVTLVLYKGSDASALSEENIGYIEQKEVNEDGSFEFVFTFKGNIEDYIATVYSSGTNGETGIVKSETVYSYVSAAAEVVSADNQVTLNAQLENESLNSISYILILMFYDEAGTLIDVFASETKSMTGETKADSLTVSKPDNAAKVFATVWSSFDTIVPYTEGTETEI